MIEATREERVYSVQTRGLNLWYGEFLALKNVDLDIRQGSITALIGPSGCGKTSLLRCINRLNERHANVRTTGQVMVFGKNVYDADVSLGELRKKVGMVFQRPNPLPLSIYENVAFGLRVHSASRTLNRRVLDELVESALTEVLLWNEVKDRFATNGHIAQPGAAAEALHRPSAPAQAARHSDGRAVFGAGRRRHRRDRAPDGSSQEHVHHRDCDAQHGTGTPDE